VSGRAERGDQPGGGKQSLVEKEFGAPVGPGPWVQRRVDNAAGLPGKQSLVEQTFGAAPRPGAPVQQRAAGGAASAARAGTPASVDAAVAQGVAAPASSAWHPIPIHELFGRRDDVSNVQARTGPEAAPAGAGAGEPESVHAAAAQGVATPASPLPHRATIQELFGPRHDVSTVQAHSGPQAAASARAMGAQAYATGNHVVLGGQTDLHIVAHEAAHVVQQRGGVQLKGGVGAAGDAYEQNADAVADRVVAGESAASLLDQMSGGGHTSGAVQRAPAMPGSSEGAAPGTSQSDPAALSRLQALLTHAGLSVDQQQLPTATLTPADATRILNRLLQSNPPLVGIGPRMVAVRLMQDVVAGGAPESVAAVVQRLGAFAPIIILRPDGYVARAVTGEAIQRAGKAEFVDGELHAGRLVTGTFYYSNGGVFYRASESLGQMGPPIGELGLEHDAVNSALDGAADALAGVAAGLYHLLRHPIDSISALRQLPGAIAQLIENCPEYWELFRAKPLNDQIRDVSQLATTLATLYGGAAGTTTRIAAAASDLGNVTIRALTLSGSGELAWATVTVPVGTVATALAGGPGAVYVLHMANSSLDKSGGSGANEGGAKPADPAKELEDIKKELDDPGKLSGKEKKALRARKKELQDHLGRSIEDAPSPEQTSSDDIADNARGSGIEHPEKVTGKGSKVDLDVVRNRPAHELISGSLKKSPSYATELADHTVGELVELQQAGGTTGVKAGKMLKLIKDAERLRGKAK